MTSNPPTEHPMNHRRKTVLFYTDLGRTVECREVQTGEVILLARYGAWADDGTGRDKPEVIDTDDNLETLKARHNDAPCFRVSDAQQEE